MTKNVNLNNIERNKKFVVHGGTWGSHGEPITLSSGKGVIIKDITGKEYIDLIAGAEGPAWVGYSNPRVVESVRKYSESTLGLVGLGFVNIPRIELAEKLAKISPPKFNKIFFGISGTETVSTALRAAHLVTKKREMIGLYRGYQGTAVECVNIGSRHGTSKQRKYLPILSGYRQIPPPYCYRCPFGKEPSKCDIECARALENMIKYGTHDEVAGFVVEPILAAGGHIILPREYCKYVREICDEHEILIIADEVQTCLGRTGKWWGSEYVGLEPDILCLSKGFGGGLPVSATIFKEDILPREYQWEKDWIAFSHSGTPFLCAVASAVVDCVIEDNAPKKASEIGKFIEKRLGEMQKEHDIIGDIRAAGAFIGIELVKNRKTKKEAPSEAPEVARRCLRKGVILSTTANGDIGNVICVKPSYQISKIQVTNALDIIKESLTEVEREI